MPTKIVLNLLALASIAVAGGETRSNLAVSAIVRPAVRIEAPSATSVTVFATMYSNSEGWIWPAADTCSVPASPKVITSSGFSQVSFSPEEVQGQNTICFASSDGTLHASARLGPAIP